MVTWSEGWNPFAGNFGRVTWSGYTDMGKIRIPPLPKWIAITDRQDGTVWYLEFVSSQDGLGYVGINTTTPRPDRDWVIFGPNDGPIITGDDTHPSLRLLVRGGVLGYEINTLDQGLSNDGRILARQGVSKNLGELYRPVSWRNDGLQDTLAYTQITAGIQPGG